MIQTVEICPRCGGRHVDLERKPLTKPSGDWEWWALCPSTGEPILTKRPAEALALVIPYPPGVNHMKGQRVVTPKSGKKPFVQWYETAELKSWKEEATLMMKSWGQREKWQAWRWPKGKEEVEVAVKYYRPRDIGDVDAPVKATLDFLQGYTYEDDISVGRLVVERKLDRGNPRAELIISHRRGT